MHIRHLSKNTFDVFLGNGWNQWTRVQRFHWGVKVIAGNKLQRTQVKELNERLIK